MGKPINRKDSIDYVDIVAENLFTDRELLRDAFWNMYDSFEYGSYDVIDFHGVGGDWKKHFVKAIRKGT